jgi:ADP-ribose pyrophosphatase YjhB (NUDIX family)
MSVLKFIHAAGGLVWREGANGRELLLVNRTKYDDWSLPKGKLDSGEGWMDAAVREVREETAVQVEIESFAGVTTYFLKLDPKVVVYWNMRALGVDEGTVINPKEIKAARWFTLEDALRQLSHEAEKTLIYQNEAVNLRP